MKMGGRCKGMKERDLGTDGNYCIGMVFYG
jgi:hypothetical protein